jgi:hypothetical protein
VTGWGVMFLGVVGGALTAGGRDRVEEEPTLWVGELEGMV